jgi:Rrf2 family iron-sulfur cluster assembly transcriptional regulator
LSCIKTEMYSKVCIYAMIYMATLPKRQERAGLKEISTAINSPEAFTAKILQDLVKNDLLTSVKGPNGGFHIQGDDSKIFPSEIVHSIDGEMIFIGCALELETCPEEHPCPSQIQSRQGPSYRDVND